jgi:hypothetical protein
MARDDRTEETHGQSAERKKKGLFRLPEGTRITFESFGKRTEVDPDSPQGERAVFGLVVCIAFQAVVTLLMVIGTSGGIKTVTTLIMAAAFVVIVFLVVFAFRGKGGETTNSFMRAFCALVLIAIVLSLAQNLDDPSQVVAGVLGIVVTVSALLHLGK